MDGIIRRREMVGTGGSSPYPYMSDFPTFNEYGTYILTYYSKTSGSGNNIYIQSGTTDYQWAGGGDLTRTIRLTIDSSQITYHYLSNGNWTPWSSKNFAGFPVRWKRCTGAKNATPLVTYIVTKE